MSYFPISDSSLAAIGMISAFQKERKTGYFEARAIYWASEKLKWAMGNLTALGDADDYMVRRGPYRDSYRDSYRAPYVLYGVKCIEPVSPASLSRWFPWATRSPSQYHPGL